MTASMAPQATSSSTNSSGEASSRPNGTSCLRVTYAGTLPATVRLYGTSSGALAPYLTLTVTRGTDAAPSFDSCSGFTADVTNYIGAGAGVVYSGSLSGYPTAASPLTEPTAGAPETGRPPRCTPTGS